MKRKKIIAICAFLLLILVTATAFLIAAIDSYNYDMDPANGVDIIEGMGAAISMASNAINQVSDIIADGTGEKIFSVGDMLFDGTVGLVVGIAGGNGASYGNTAGIKAAGKQLFKRGFFNPQARSYYAKVAHNASKQYVFDPLLKSMGYSSIGAGVTTVKNILSKLF